MATDSQTFSKAGIVTESKRQYYYINTAHDWVLSKEAKSYNS